MATIHNSTSFLSTYATRATSTATGRCRGHWHGVTLQQPGLVEVAGWPARPGEHYGAKLLDLLEVRIEEAEDPGERTRLQRFREAVSTVGTNVVSGAVGS